jgi:hypothetical protein
VTKKKKEDEALRECQEVKRAVKAVLKDVLYKSHKKGEVKWVQFPKPFTVLL